PPPGTSPRVQPRAHPRRAEAMRHRVALAKPRPPIACGVALAPTCGRCRATRTRWCSPLAYGATTDRGSVEPTGTRLPAGGPPADAGPRCGDDRGVSRLSGGAGMSLTDSAQYYHEVLKRIPPRAAPAFEDEAMQERVWGRRWGVYDDVGPLRMVLVHRPGDSIRVMTADHYDPTIEALIDD